MTRAKAKYDIEAVDKTKAAIQSIEKNVRNVDKAFKAVAAAGALVMGARGIGAGFKSLVLDSAKALDEVAKSANRLGTNVETLQGFRHATELAGGSAQDLELAWKTAGKNLTDAALGMGEGKAALEKLGISATDSAGRIKSADRVMLEFADKLPRLGSDAEVTAAAMKIFGESGTKLIPMLRGGSDAMRSQIAEGRALSLVTSDMTAKAEAFTDAQARLKTAVTASSNSLATVFMPALTNAAEAAAWELVDAVSGIDREARVGLATLATFEDKDFFGAAATEAEMLSSNLNAATTKWLKLDALRKEWEDGNIFTRALKGSEYWEPLDGLDEAADEMNKLHRVQQALGRIVDARVTSTQKEREVTKAMLVQRSAELTALGKIYDQDHKILAQRRLQAEELDDGMKAQRDALDYLKESFEYVMDLPPPEIDLGPVMDAADKYKLTWADAGKVASDSLSNTLGWGMAQLATEGKTSADFFEQVWKDAIAAVAAEMSRQFLKRKLFPAIASLIPGFGWLAQTANVTALPAVTGGGGNTYVLNQQTLAPATTADLVRAHRTFRDADREAARFAVGR